MAQFHKRQFLNDEQEGGSAHLEFKVGEVETNRDKDDGWISTTFTLSDCTRAIDLDFSCNGKTDIDRIRTKYAKLRRAVLAFGVALNDELNRLEEL